MKFNLVLIAIAACLLASVVPILHTDVWYSQFVAVMLFGFLMIGFKLFELSKPLALLFIYLIYSTIFVNQQDTMSIICLLQTAFCLSLSLYISKCSPEQIRKIWVVIGSLLGLQVIWGFIQYSNHDPIFHLNYYPDKSDTVGFSGSHNQYGLFLAAASPLSFIMPMLIPFVFLSIVFSKTFSAMLGFIVAGIFFFRKKLDYRVILIGVFLTAGFFFLMTHKDLSGKFTERFGLWKLTTEQTLNGRAVMQINENVQKIVTCNKWFGYGFSKFFTISPYTQKDIIIPGLKHRYEHAHNDYVECLFDLGIIGCILLFWVFYDLIKRYIAQKTKSISLELSTCGLIAYSVCALSIYTVHTAYNGMFLCVLLGIFFAEVKTNGT